MHRTPRHHARLRPCGSTRPREPHQRVTLLLSALLVSATLTAGCVVLLVGAAGGGLSGGPSRVAGGRLQGFNGPVVATLPPGVVGVGAGQPGAPSTAAPSTARPADGRLTRTSDPIGPGLGGLTGAEAPPAGGVPTTGHAATPPPSRTTRSPRPPVTTGRPGSTTTAPSTTGPPQPTEPPEATEPPPTTLVAPEGGGPGVDRYGP